MWRFSTKKGHIFSAMLLINDGVRVDLYLL